MTKRDLYYQNCTLFKNQNVCNYAIDDIAISMGVTRFDLGIVASSKGLVVGPIKFWLQDDSFLDATQNPIFIPDHHQIKSFQSHALSVLVIEKDATFQALIQSQFLIRFPFTILLTGKGYPDVATRALLVDLYQKTIPLSLYLHAEHAKHARNTNDDSNDRLKHAEHASNTKDLIEIKHAKHARNTNDDSNDRLKHAKYAHDLVNRNQFNESHESVPDVDFIYSNDDNDQECNEMVDLLDSSQFEMSLQKELYLSQNENEMSMQKEMYVSQNENEMSLPKETSISQNDIQDFEQSFWDDKDEDPILFHNSTCFSFTKNQLYSSQLELDQQSQKQMIDSPPIPNSPCIDPYEIFFSDSMHECIPITNSINANDSTVSQNPSFPITLPKMKTYMLADCDPDGFEIYLTYQSGSSSLYFYSMDLVCSDLEWLGIKPSHLFGPLKIQIPEPVMLMNLTMRDRKKMIKYLRENATSPYRRMIQGQLLAGYKAELQVMTIETLLNEIIAPVLTT